ncbi:unnamed protein product [Jaminaea pallidilutea]
MPPRRSVREHKARQAVSKDVDASKEDAEGSGAESGLESSPALSSSAGSQSDGDDWEPEKPKSSRGRGKRRAASFSEDDDEDIDEGATERRRSATNKTSVTKRQKKEKAGATVPEQRDSSNVLGDDPQNQNQEQAREKRPGDDYDEEIDEEAERSKLEQEAQDAWATVRAKKATGGKPAETDTKKAPPPLPETSTNDTPSTSTSNATPAATSKKSSLNSWLGLAAVPWPTSPESARVFDRDSLFIGFVYPVTSSSASTIAQHLDHLTNSVHPTLPASIFPSAFSHLEPRRRGSSHDMHALRALELKRGRNGLDGPNDYGIEEKSDDDGERWGGDKILRAMREMGAVDLLVVVSRWYGGQNLGPVRFDHILTCAREAMKAYMVQEAVGPLRKEIQDLDVQIAALRAETGGGGPASSTSTQTYEDADFDRANRLVVARRKTLELLQKRKQSVASSNASTKGGIVLPDRDKETTDESKSRSRSSPHAGSEGGGGGAIGPATRGQAGEPPWKANAKDDGTAEEESKDADAALAGWDDLA